MFFLRSRLLEEKQALRVHWSATELGVRPPFSLKRSQGFLGGREGEPPDKTDSWRGPSLPQWVAECEHAPAAWESSASAPISTEPLRAGGQYRRRSPHHWLETWQGRCFLAAVFSLATVPTDCQPGNPGCVKMNSHTRPPNPLNKVQTFAIYTRLELVTLWYSLTGLWTEKTNPNEEHHVSVARSWSPEAWNTKINASPRPVSLALRYAGREATLDCETESQSGRGAPGKWSPEECGDSLASRNPKF